jgi:hypothetical protein
VSFANEEGSDSDAAGHISSLAGSREARWYRRGRVAGLAWFVQFAVGGVVHPRAPPAYDAPIAAFGRRHAAWDNLLVERKAA